MDLVLTLALFLLALVFRFWQCQQLGLTHFDEGSYTMTGKWLVTGGREGWVFQINHAPPLFSAMVGLAFLVFGTSDTAAIGVSAFWGALTVPLVYLMGKPLFGRVAALSGALLLVLCEYHLIFSRMALTDASFSFFFWASLAAFWQACRSGKHGWCLAAGLLTGLCWNTKYHGFFPLLIGLIWVVTQTDAKAGNKILHRLRWSNLKPWALTAVVAAFCYLPWFVYVQWAAGYDWMLSYQKGYIFQMETLLQGPANLMFFLLKWAGWPLLILALIGAAYSLSRNRARAAFLIVPLTFFALSTLFYTSFPRLALPLIPGLCLLAGCGVKAFSRLKFGPVLSVSVFVLTLGWSWVGAKKTLSLPTHGYRQVAERLQTTTHPLITQLNKNYYFYEDTPSREMRWEQLGDLDALLATTNEAIFAVDPILHRLKVRKKWFETLKPKLTLVHSIEIQAYEILYYQGIENGALLEQLPLSQAPFRPGSHIVIYRYVRDGSVKQPPLTGAVNDDTW